MRRTNVFVVVAVLLIVSCSKEPNKPGSIEKRNDGEGGTQSSITKVEAKQPDRAEIEKELKQLEGVWNEVLTELDGQRKETARDADYMSILTFKGDEMTEKKKGSDKLFHSGKIRIDPSKNPKTLEFFVSGTKNPAREVYELQGDELKICSILGGNRFPEELTGKNPRHLLVIYKRVKK